MTLGEYIINYCNSHGISKRQFADMCGVTSGYISMVVNNVNPKTGKPLKPTIETYMKFASAMGMSVDQLFGEIEDSPVSLVLPTREEDEELWQIREDFRRNPELRTLHSLTRNATKKEVKQVEAFIRAIRSSNDYEEDDTP